MSQPPNWLGVRPFVRLTYYEAAPVRIEQAVFTSAETDRAQGYQLLSRSPNLAEADAREISVWAPSHGSLLDLPGEVSSDNFFQLASGSYCVSRSTRAGAEYSGRGETIYTQFLVVPPELLAKFANNPFAILRAAAASGALCVHDSVPEKLEAIQLAGRAPVVDLSLMAQLARDPGPAAIATLVQTALASDRLAIYSTTPCEHLIAGLFNVLPVECRTAFSFTTCLTSSPSRPVRLSALPPDESTWRPIARQGITLLHLDPNAAPAIEWSGWAAWVAGILSSGKLSVLAAELEQERPGVTCADLDELGDKLQEALRSGHSFSNPKPAATEPPGSKKRRTRDSRQRADRAHAAHQSSMLIEPAARPEELDSLAKRLADQPEEILEMLERIDDLVFAAIAGDPKALAELEVLWPLTASELDPNLVEQTREQYLRCALSICSDFSEGEGRRPERAIAAVDVLCVLFEE